jgi:hypothetical protein
MEQLPADSAPTGTEDTVERYFARTTRRTTGTVREQQFEHH